MNLWAQSDYREALKALVKERKKFARGFGFHLLAEAARIQRPYLSKVMNGTAHLSSDQLYLIGKFLRLADDEQEFLQLLLEHDRTGVDERKKRLKAQIKKIAETHRESGKHLSAKSVAVTLNGESQLADYYLDPYMQIIHMALSIEAFSRQPLLLATELQLPGMEFYGILASLERMGLVTKEGNRYVQRESQLHLPKTSPIYRAWRSQLKSLAAQRINQSRDPDTYSFSAVFSADHKTRKALHDHFLEFLKNSESLVTEAPAKQVFQMSFDLFAWTASDEERGEAEQRG